jgi:hypothetical protein
MKNVALGFLNKQEYDDYLTWIGNWSKMLIVCNYLDPDRWIKIVDPVRDEFDYDSM